MVIHDDMPPPLLMAVIKSTNVIHPGQDTFLRRFTSIQCCTAVQRGRRGKTLRPSQENGSFLSLPSFQDIHSLFPTSTCMFLPVPSRCPHPPRHLCRRRSHASSCRDNRSHVPSSIRWIHWWMIKYCKRRSRLVQNRRIKLIHPI